MAQVENKETLCHLCFGHFSRLNIQKGMTRSNNHLKKLSIVHHDGQEFACPWEGKTLRVTFKRSTCLTLQREENFSDNH